MKVTAAREALLKPLQAVIGVVERRQTMPILANVLLVARDGDLAITATDLEVELVANTGVNVDAPGEVTVPGRKLLDSGVPVAVAPEFNPGSSPSFHLPLAMLQACLYQGMTPQEVLSGATTVAARAVSRQHRIGSLLPGYQADIALIDAPDLNQWMYHFQANACRGVIKKGLWL